MNNELPEKGDEHGKSGRETRLAWAQPTLDQLGDTDHVSASAGPAADGGFGGSPGGS